MRANASAPLRATPTNSTSSARAAKFGRCDASAQEPAPMTPRRSLPMIVDDSFSVGGQADAELVERHRRDQQSALRDGLPEARHVQQHEPVVERADDEQAEHRADDRPPPAREAGAAED